MGNNIIETVIAIEKALEEELLRKKEEVSSMIYAEKCEYDKKISLEEEAYKKSTEKRIKQETLEFEREAENIVKEAEKIAMALEKVSDEQVLNIIKKYIKKIVDSK